MAFFQNIIRVCRQHRQALFRLAAVLCLYGAFAAVFIRPGSGAEPLSAQMLPAQTGLGGGYLENDGGEGQLGQGWSMEAGMLEPESFSKPRMLLYSNYAIQKGDIIGELAENFGLNQDTLISINNIKNTRLIQIGQVLRVPNQDGIMYTVKRGDTLDSIAEKHSSDPEAIRLANELFSNAAVSGKAIFIPGARLDWVERQEINGDLFIWPASGYITSSYGYRRWPFGGSNVRQFHSGIDIGAPMGAPVRAAMSGRVSAVGWDNALGNYVAISHHSGYRTMYGHLSAVRVKSGAYVGTGERIGDVGSTGMSTGPHLHFTVYKNGVTVNPRSLMK
ncbi:MAG: M23 family metallopeptidase [Treponema sp.]|nr:M23 family metallopeptidase [Treponema sp.]